MWLVSFFIISVYLFCVKNKEMIYIYYMIYIYLKFIFQINLQLNFTTFLCLLTNYKSIYKLICLSQLVIHLYSQFMIIIFFKFLFPIRLIIIKYCIILQTYYYQFHFLIVYQLNLSNFLYFLISFVVHFTNSPIIY